MFLKCAIRLTRVIDAKKCWLLREKLLQAEKARAAGDKGISVDELDERLGKIIKEVRGCR